jgi:hypothetical protein
VLILKEFAVWAAARRACQACLRRQLSLADNPGIEFEFQAERWHSRQRVYIVKDKLLGVSSTARGSEPLPPATDRIFDSLRLLK